MRPIYPTVMNTTGKALIDDYQTRCLEMKSVQPYSSNDEYLYAMKEDLADWFTKLYPEWGRISADNFFECFENGVLLCQHANNLNYAARKTQHSLHLEHCKYRTDARPQTFNARDNVSQFIKWARRVVGVREVLMFESDDLILRKNEKNFLLCLLEIARYGSQFGVSVPEIIQLENEIEKEIQRDKQTEIMSFTELRRLQRDEQHNRIRTNSSSLGKYGKLLRFVRHEHRDASKNSYNNFSLTHSNGASWLRQRISKIPRLTHHDKKKRYSYESNYDATMYDETTIPASSPNEPIISRTLANDDEEAERQRIELTKASSSPSPLHKTVVQLTDSCCCAQQFPVIRIGEGKYRIGESGTIIFIRILRSHVMVRVGGGWDTLENYLNKHDPCRRANFHRGIHLHERHKEIPIVSVDNSIPTSNLHKMGQSGKSVTIKTEEFPLTRSTTYDTNLTNAQLVVTRDADGRHRIDQITYKSDENLFHPSNECPHRSTVPSPSLKVKSVRGTGRSSVLASTKSQSYTLNHDQDTSSFTVSSLTDNQPTHSPCSPIFTRAKEPKSIVDNFDQFMTSNLPTLNDDFDLTDVEDAMRSHRITFPNEDTTAMDEDSLESCSGTIDEMKQQLPPSPMISHRSVSMLKVKPGGFCTALYLAQKQKQTSTMKPWSTISGTRLSTLPNVMDIFNTDDETSHQSPSQRKVSNEYFSGDSSKLDRDSGFDEIDFRRERLHSGVEEDSSSLSSRRSSLAQSFSSDNHNQNYRENKAYELRLKALDFTKNYHEQSSLDSRSPLKKNFNYSSTKTNDSTPTHRFRKNNPYYSYLK